MAKEYSREIEWPTVALIAADYIVLALLVWFHASLPWWVILPVGAAFWTELAEHYLRAA